MAKESDRALLGSGSDCIVTWTESVRGKRHANERVKSCLRINI
jgi:hypothetical protein